MITREILLNILTDKEKYNLIIKDYPGLYSSIITINQNKSEDNVNNAIKKIFDFIEKNSKIKEFIENIIKKEESNPSTKNDVSGVVIEIDKNDESYSDLMKRVKKEKWNYKGLTIVDGYDKLKIYFY
jgi:hypothetical protein